MAALIPTARQKIAAFDLTDVVLHAGPLRRQFEQARDYYLQIPNDDMLFGFRQRAGQPSPGKPMGGWYYGDDRAMWYSGGGGAHTFGQWLSAFARMARATDDDALRHKALTLLAGWAQTWDADGFAGSQGRDGTAAIGHYTFDKFCGGLVDVAHYLGDDHAVGLLKTLTRWANRRLGRERRPATFANQSGNAPGAHDGEWYTLSENLYRAFVLTGDEAYRDDAQLWHYDAMWAGLAAGRDAFVGGHAYSHVNTLSSAAMAYAVLGDERWLQAIINGYDLLQANHTYATGGYGPNETFFPSRAYLSWSLWHNRNWLTYPANFEVPCGCWAAFKLCGYLLQFTRDPRYADWAECLLHSALRAALPMAGYGETYYYADYALAGGQKTYYPELWPCCSGTYPLAVTECHNLLYYHDDAGLYVSLYAPSSVRWQHQGATVHVRQETAYPDDGHVRLTVALDVPQQFALHLRVPGWLQAPARFSLNGEPIAVDAAPGAWATIARQWLPGDRVELDLPMAPEAVPIDPDEPERAALRVGPVVLVSDHGGPLYGDWQDPRSWLEQGDAPLHLLVRGGRGRQHFRPFYEVPAGERYWMYRPILGRSLCPSEGPPSA